MFVARYKSPNIEVYKRNADDVKIQRNVIVAGAMSFRGLAACEFNQCLYASAQNNRIHKVSPVANSMERIIWLLSADLPSGVTVNNAHNLLVACYCSRKVQEYTTDGAMVREINLHPDITNPTHVVQLPGGEFGVISHGSLFSPHHRYCVVGSDGKIVKSTGSEQMSYPRGLAVSKDGSKVFVADSGNNRILLLNSKTLSTEQLPAAFNVGFKQPHFIHFDSSAGVIYAGEWMGGCIFCFKK